LARFCGGGGLNHILRTASSSCCGAGIATASILQRLSKIVSTTHRFEILILDRAVTRLFTLISPFHSIVAQQTFEPGITTKIDQRTSSFTGHINTAPLPVIVVILFASSGLTLVSEAAFTTNSLSKNSI
jgi:hypothetical protein